jgi:hypothetical protein
LDPTWDAVVESDTLTALTRVGADVGTPVISLSPPDGPSIFGPVLSRRPPEDRSVELWDATVALAMEPGFSEIKRKRPRRSLFLDNSFPRA